MALKVPNEGEKLLMQWALKDSTGTPDLKLRLFTNDYTPVDTSDSTDFVEATFSGYSAPTLNRTGWNDTTTNGAGAGEVVYGTAQTFDASSSETLYGYYITTDDSASDLVWCERFGSARAVENGDSITLTPKLTGSSAN